MASLVEWITLLPEPYAATENALWDDDYISGQMLKAHLDDRFDAASRRLAFMQRSAAWIASLAKGRLLDLGCGPGRYAQLFAGQGFAVTGIDLSRRSIAYARAQAEKEGLAINYVQDSYLEHTWTQSFDIAVLIYCDYGVLPPDARHALLQNVRKALRPGGLLILDAFTKAHFAQHEAETSIRAQAEAGGFWDAKPYAVVERRLAYDGGIYLTQDVIIDHMNRVKAYNIWNTAFDEQKLRGEMLAAGFAKAAFYGDVAGSAVHKEDKTICVVATA